MLKANNLAGQVIGGYHLSFELTSLDSQSTYLGESETEPKRQVMFRLISHHPITSHVDQENFLQEAEILRQLKHPHILPILDYGLTQGLPYVITPYTSWHNLSTHIRRRWSSSANLRTTIVLLTQIGQALQYAHQQHIFHGQLTPQHILLDTQNTPLLTNFRFTSLATGLTASAPLNAGVPDYRAPEQCKGSIKKESDQYALACIAYELLTGCLPNSVEQAPSSLNADVPVALDQAILKALSTDPSQRFASMQEFLAELQRPQNQASLPPRPTRHTTPPPQGVAQLQNPAKLRRTARTRTQPPEPLVPGQKPKGLAPSRRLQQPITLQPGEPVSQQSGEQHNALQALQKLVNEAEAASHQAQKALQDERGEALQALPRPAEENQVKPQVVAPTLMTSGSLQSDDPLDNHSSLQSTPQEDDMQPETADNQIESQTEPLPHMLSHPAMANDQQDQHSEEMESAVAATPSQTRPYRLGDLFDLLTPDQEREVDLLAPLTPQTWEPITSLPQATEADLSAAQAWKPTAELRRQEARVSGEAPGGQQPGPARSADLVSPAILPPGSTMDPLKGGDPTGKMATEEERNTPPEGLKVLFSPISHYPLSQQRNAKKQRDDAKQQSLRQSPISRDTEDILLPIKVPPKPELALGEEMAASGPVEAIAQEEFLSSQNSSWEYDGSPSLLPRVAPTAPIGQGNAPAPPRRPEADDAYQERSVQIEFLSQVQIEKKTASVDADTLSWEETLEQLWREVAENDKRESVQPAKESAQEPDHSFPASDEYELAVREQEKKGDIAAVTTTSIPLDQQQKLPPTMAAPMPSAPVIQQQKLSSNIAANKPSVTSERTHRQAVPTVFQRVQQLLPRYRFPVRGSNGSSKQKVLLIALAAVLIMGTIGLLYFTVASVLVPTGPSQQEAPTIANRTPMTVNDGATTAVVQATAPSGTVPVQGQVPAVATVLAQRPEATNVPVPSNAQNYAFEDGSTDGWSGSSGRVSVTSAQAYSGSHSLQLSISRCSNYANVHLSSSQIAIQPGQKLSLSVRAAGATQVRLAIRDNSGTWYTSGWSSLSAKSWQAFSYKVPSASTPFNDIEIDVNCSAGTAYFDDIGWG